MTNTTFSLQFDLNLCEIRKLNKMYFRGLYQKRILFFLATLLLVYIFTDLSNNNDVVELVIRDLLLVIVFLLFQYTFINAICKVIFQLINKLLQSDRFISRYKFNFTNSNIYVHSPLGEYIHTWSQIENAILTKDFFFLYIRDKNNYIISISNKYRKLDELITFIENNVTQITKV